MGATWKGSSVLTADDEKVRSTKTKGSDQHISSFHGILALIDQLDRNNAKHDYRR